MDVMGVRMQKNDVTEVIKKGKINCSQIILKEFMNECGFDEKLAYSLCKSFGGGFGEASFCGSVSASLLVIGAVFKENESKCDAKTKEFLSKLKAKYPSFICKDILGADFTKSEGLKLIQENELFVKICPDITYYCIKILREILRD